MVQGSELRVKSSKRVKPIRGGAEQAFAAITEAGMDRVYS